MRNTMFWRKLERFLCVLEQFSPQKAKKIYRLRRYCIQQIRRRDYRQPEYERLLWEAQVGLPINGFRGGWEWTCLAKNEKEFANWLNGMNELVRITKMELFGSSLVDSFSSAAIETARKLGCSEPPANFLPQCFWSDSLQKANIKFDGRTLISCPWGKTSRLKAAKGEFYPEMNLVVLHSGRNHSAVGAFLQAREAVLELRQLTPLFSTLSTDGAEWFDSKTDLSAPVSSERFAFLYTLLQHRWKTEQKFKASRLSLEKTSQ